MITINTLSLLYTDVSLVPSDEELFELSILLSEAPFQYGVWRQLSYELGIPKYRIKEDHSLTRELEVMDLLILWRDKYSSQKPSWRVLLSAIEDTYGHHLANFIRSNFNLP